MRAIAVAAGAAAVLSFVPASQAADRDREPRVWSDQWQMTGRPTVRVGTGDAKVIVHTREGNEVAVEVRGMGTRRGWFVADRDPDVRFSRRGSRIDISARMRGGAAGVVLSTLRLQVEVWVPRETDLYVRTGDGDVTLGPLDGRIHVVTGSPKGYEYLGS